MQQQQQALPWWVQQFVPGGQQADVDQDTEWNVSQEGGPLSRTGWSAWAKLPTGATTDTPAPLPFRNDLHLFVRGTDKRICDTRDDPRGPCEHDAGGLVAYQP